MQTPRRVVIAALAITLGAAAPAAAGKPPAILASLPDDTAVLAAIELRKAAASPLAASAIDAVRASAADGLARIKALGVDVENDVDRVYIAVAGTGVTDLSRARIKILIAEGALRLDPTAASLTAKTHGGVTYWTDGEVDLAMVGKRLYVVSDGHMASVIDLARGKGKSAARSRAAGKLRAAIAATTTTHHGWLVSVLTNEDRAQMGGTAADLTWVSVSARLRADALDVAMRLGTTTPTAAAAIAAAASSQLAQVQAGAATIGLADLANSLRVSASGVIVAVGATATEQEISVISGLLQMAAGALASGATSSTP